MKPQPRYKPGDRIGGRYQVHKALMGGMGEVYLCLDLEENYPYALKTFQQRYLTDAQRLRRAFEQEVATWVALEKHPNIARCFWMQIIDNQPFMALEWIAGEEGRGADLRGWLRRGPLDLKLALEIGIDICNGLIHARQKQPGLVHRDLKPENILMAQGGLAKITDFGLAQIIATTGLVVAQEDATADSRQSFVGGKGIAGTPAYMAPEQWRSERLDERTDIYALGCILHELLTGTPPFSVDCTPTTPQQLQRWLTAMQAAHEGTPYPQRADAFAPALHNLLAVCLAKAPADRPAQLTDLLAHLTELYQKHFANPFPARPAHGLFTENDFNNRGNTYHALQQHERALADYEQALTLNPNFALAYANLGATYTALRRHTEALNSYNRAISLDPTAQVYANRGASHCALALYPQALDDFGRSLELDPNTAIAYVNRGITYADLGRYTQALDDFGRALALDLNLPQAYYHRGNTYAHLGKRDQALDDFNRCIALVPNLTQAYYDRGMIYFDLGEHKQALDDFDCAVALEPTNALIYFGRGNTYAALGWHKQALDDYNQVIALAPNFPNVYYNRGNTYAALGELVQAKQDFDQEIRFSPDNAQAHVNRGITHAALQEYERAFVDYNRAIGLNPNLAQAYIGIGTLLWSQGRLEMSLPYFDQAAQLGLTTGAQYAAQIRQRLEKWQTPQINLAQQAYDAFQQAASLEDMRQTVAFFPLLIKADFMAAIEQLIVQKVPPEMRLAWQQRLIWLRQIADEHKQ